MEFLFIFRNPNHQRISGTTWWTCCLPMCLSVACIMAPTGTAPASQLWLVTGPSAVYAHLTMHTQYFLWFCTAQSTWILTYRQVWLSFQKLVKGSDVLSKNSVCSSTSEAIQLGLTNVSIYRYHIFHVNHSYLSKSYFKCNDFVQILHLVCPLLERM